MKTINTLLIALVVTLFACTTKFDDGNNFSFRSTEKRLSKGIWLVDYADFGDEIYNNISADDEVKKEEWYFTDGGAQNGTLEIRKDDSPTTSLNFNFTVIGDKNNLLSLTHEDGELLFADILELRKKRLVMEVYFEETPYDKIHIEFINIQ